MRFLCVFLSCVALGSCGGKYKAEVQVVSSNPHEYGVSVVTRTYPASLKDITSDADESKPPAGPSSSSSSAAIASPDNVPRLSESSSIPRDDASSTIGSETHVNIVTNTQDGLRSSNVDASPPPRAPQAQVPIFLPSRSQQLFNNTMFRTRKSKNNLRDRNNQISACQTPSCGSLTYQTDTNQTIVHQMPQDQTPLNSSQTSEIKVSNIPTNYTPASQADKIVPQKDKVDRLLTNQTINLQNASINQILANQTISQNRLTNSLQTAANHTKTLPQFPTNHTRTSEPAPTNQHSLIDQSATFRQASTNQTTSQQAPTTQTRIFQNITTDKIRVAHAPKIHQSATYQQTTQEDPTYQTDEQQEQVEQTGIIQETDKQTFPNQVEITQVVSNQTNAIQQVPSSLTESSTPQAPSNQTQTKEVFINQIITTPNTQENTTLFPQKKAVHTPLGGNETHPATNLTQRNRQNIAGERSVRRARKPRRARRSIKFVNKTTTPEDLPRGIIKQCPCASEVIKKLTCPTKKLCTAPTTTLLWVVFAHAVVILVIYVMLLLYIYHGFRLRRKREIAWLKEAIKWERRERKGSHDI